MSKPVGKPFQPGQSGNPGGRPKMPDALKARIAKLASKEAVDVLESALTSADEKVRSQAAGMLMDRAWGKAITPTDIKANFNAAVPLHTHSACLDPTREAMAFSNSSTRKIFFRRSFKP